MSFSDAVAVCLRKYADFSGRAGRPEFWWFFVFNVAVSFVAGWLDEGTGLDFDGGAAYAADGVISLAASLALLLPSLAVGARRLHDTGRSGWWLLLSLVPCLGLIALIVMWCLPGDPHSNDYGEQPVRTGPTR